MYFMYVFYQLPFGVINDDSSTVAELLSDSDDSLKMFLTMTITFRPSWAYFQND